LPYYVCALPTKKGSAAVQEFISDDPEKIEQWAQAHDKPGLGIYDCHNPLKPGATARNKGTVAAVVEIYVDIDPKDINESLTAVDELLRELLITPTEIRNSGRGRHVIYRLKEPISTDDPAMMERADTVRSRLTEILCGDRQVCHHASLRRRLGTHNTKDSAWVLCETLSTGNEVDLTELEDMVAIYDRPLFTRKQPPDTVASMDFTAGSDGGEGKAPIDVDARLAAMRYQGAGDSGINITWWECMGSLLRHGGSVNDTLNRLHAAAEDDPNKANWIRDLTGMMERWLKHEPQFLQALDTGLYKQWQTATATGKNPRLIWRQDLKQLQVRGLGQPVEPRSLGAAVADSNGATVTTLAQPTAAPARRIVLLPYAAPDPAKIPRREWLFDYHYMRKISHHWSRRHR
jgi:hypothetical protein